MLAAEASLRRLEHLRGEDYLAFRHEHEAELLAATDVLERVQLVQQAVIETQHAAEATYGSPILCNLDEERMPPIDALFAEYVTEVTRRTGEPAEAVHERLLHAELQEVLPRRLIEHFRCPDRPAPASLTAPGSPPPPAFPTH